MDGPKDSALAPSLASVLVLEIEVKLGQNRIYIMVIQHTIYIYDMIFTNITICICVMVFVMLF